MFHGHYVLKDEVLNENSCHFEIVDGECVVCHQFYDVWGPFDAPYNRLEGFGAREPDATSSVLAGIAIAKTVWVFGDQLAAVDWFFRQEFEHNSKVREGRLLG